MFPFENTAMENRQGRFDEIRDFFKEHGFEIGGNWETDHAFFDKKLKDNPGYLFIRIPVFVDEGTFGEDDAVLRVGTPFLLRHKYNPGLDDNVQVDTFDSALDQFSEPVDPDASIEQKEVEETQPLIRELEQAFQQRFSQ